MEPRLQRRVQRYGWDRAVAAYEQGWRDQLEPAHDADARHGGPAARRARARRRLRHRAGQLAHRRGGRRGAARSSAPTSRAQMVEAARRDRGGARPATNVRFERGDAEALPFADASFDAAVCGLGLMYVAGPGQGARARCAGCCGPAAARPRRCGVPGATAAGPRSSRSPMRASPPTSARCSSVSAPRTCWRAAFAAAGFVDVRLERLRDDAALRLAPRTRSARCSAAARWRSPTAASTRRRRRAVHAEYLDSIAAYRARRWLPDTGRVRGRRRPGLFPRH